MKRLRFDVDLTDEEYEQLQNLCDVCHRSRKNLAEALIKLTISVYSKKGWLVPLASLGLVNEKKVNGAKD